MLFARWGKAWLAKSMPEELFRNSGSLTHMAIYDQSHLPREKYESSSYNKKERFINYYHQISEVLALKPNTVLEIGIGSGIVYHLLKKSVADVKGLDINAALSPDILGSVEKIPLPDQSVDVVLAAEILEHLPFKKFETSLKEIFRTAKCGAIISLPDRGATFSLSLKIPIIPWIRGVFKIPYFWKTESMSEEHFWEIGLKGYSVHRVRAAMRSAGFTIAKEFIPHDDVYHRFFVLLKL